ncbi:hypothetical protein BDW02DRAFT_10168 [Decorospora gaudefroyi]|uniref:Uncharacterized protein n=1 Tax=Decorospora gaudefroyi TaxID=184978 RepID=A0A6A5KXM2_9PLEO|nr:hypothetical protein BDW02DRAFT_10168 [Decorospora gaudefroyi]
MTATPTTTTIITAIPTNTHDHTIGHCRAQRQALYYACEHCAEPHPIMSTTNTTAVCATNAHDHTIGHCRAQRQALYSCTELCSNTPAVQPTPALLHPTQTSASTSTTASVSASASASEDEWTDSQEELERWGMEESVVETKKSPTADSRLKFDEVSRFWQ